MKAKHKFSWTDFSVGFAVGLLALVLVAIFVVTPREDAYKAQIDGLKNASPVVVGADFSKFQNDKPFRFIGTNREVPVVKIMIAGFLQACDDYKLKCELMTVDGNDIAKSVTLTEQSVALGSSGILATVYDKAWYKPVQDAIKSGIPVVNGHFPMKTDGPIPGLLGWSAPDNTGYALKAADAIADKISCKGVVAITQSSLNDGENAVAKAFHDELLVKCPSIKILDPQLETTDPAKAMATTGAIIQANKDLTAGFSTTGGGATAWAQGAKENGKKPGELVIIGMDFTRENLTLVDNGEVYAIVAQPVFSEMYHGVVLLLEKAMGNDVPYENTLPAPLVFKGQTTPYYQILDRADKVK
jgi:ABC-type sugar transport system substrate-binding protein